MLQIKFGISPDISKLRCPNIVKVAFKMLETSLEKRASPEEVISELEKILESLSALPALKQVQT